MPVQALAAAQTANTLPSASDQFAAALNAPLPFLLALFAVVSVLAVAIWRRYAWRYDGVIDILKMRIELARDQNEAAKGKEKELEDTVKTLQSETADLVKKTQGDLTLNPLALNLSSTTDTASSQITQLSTANNNVREFLSSSDALRTFLRKDLTTKRSD